MLKVCKHQCDQCLFGKDKIVSNSRRREILNDCVKQDTHFLCHKGSIVGEDLVCRGFFKNYSTNLIRISGRLKMIEFVNPAEVLRNGLLNGQLDKEYI